MAAPVVASVGAVGKTNPVNDPGVPSGVVAGSLVVVFIEVGWSKQPTFPAAITPDTGFLLGSSQVAVNATYGGYFGWAWYYKYATAADTGTYSFTISDLGGAIYGSMAYAVRITGGPTSGNPFVDLFHPAHSSTSTTSITVPSFTPGGDDSLLLGGVFLDDIGTIGAPAGWTIDAQTVDTVYAVQIGIAHAAQSTAAATGAVTFTSTVSTPMLALVGTIRPPVSQYPVGGTVAGVSTVSGIVTARRPATGTVDAISTTAGAPSARLNVAGTAAAGSDVAGVATALQAVSGTVDAVSGTAGTVQALLAVSGGVDAVSDTVGVVASRQTVIGRVDAVSGVSGVVDLVPHGTFAVTGRVDATSHATGVVTARHAVTGTIDAVSAVDGTVHALLTILGTVTAISSVRGVIGTFGGRDITVTARVANRRWTAAIPARTRSGSTSRRWAGTNG